MSEWEFSTLLAEEADCGLLLDINNVYVTCFNHDLEPAEFIRTLPHQRIVQFHLAGHTDCGTHIIDTHDNHVINPVWELYRLACQLTGDVSTLLEWDANIPEFDVVHNEVLRARQFMGEYAQSLEYSHSFQALPQLNPQIVVPQPPVFETAEVE